MSLQIIYCFIFNDNGTIRSNITESLDYVKSKYEYHKKTKTLHLFNVIKHTKIRGSTEFEYEVMDFRLLEKKDTLHNDLMVATYND